MNTKTFTGVVEAVLGLALLVMGPLVVVAFWNHLWGSILW